MLTLRLLVLFVHIVAVIVALGGSHFSTFALAPVLASELDSAARVRVARRIDDRDDLHDAGGKPTSASKRTAQSRASSGWR